MTTTELIELLKKYEHGGASGRPRDVMICVGDEIYDTNITGISTGDGLFAELFLDIDAQPTAEPQIIHCKDCKYFNLDHWENIHGIPLIVAHEICTKWSGGCKTKQDGYCFMAERRTDEAVQNHS